MAIFSFLIHHHHLSITQQNNKKHTSYVIELEFYSNVVFIEPIESNKRDLQWDKENQAIF